MSAACEAGTGSRYSITLLAKAPVDLKALARNALALVGRQKQRQTCDVAWRHRIGNGLTRAKFSDLLLVRKPQPTLALGDHHAGRNRVDPNAVCSNQPGQRVGETDDRRLRGFGGLQRRRPAY